MTTSENEKTGAEARADVAHRRSQGRYESGLARELAGLAYRTFKEEKEEHATKEEHAEDDAREK
jgi:hypothetical protein